MVGTQERRVAVDIQEMQASDSVLQLPPFRTLRAGAADSILQLRPLRANFLYFPLSISLFSSSKHVRTRASTQTIDSILQPCLLRTELANVHFVLVLISLFGPLHFLHQ